MVKSGSAPGVYTYGRPRGIGSAAGPACGCTGRTEHEAGGRERTHAPAWDHVATDKHGAGTARRRTRSRPPVREISSQLSTATLLGTTHAHS
jgi:hypothetical protein